MIFDELMAKQKRVIQGFLDDPDRPLMVLRTDADTEMVAARMIAAWGEDVRSEDELGKVIAFGLSAPFTTPEEFYGICEAELAQTVDELAASYAELIEAEKLDELVLPKAMAKGRAHPSAEIELLFAEYLEGIARGLAGWHETMIVAIRFDEIADLEGCQASLARLSTAIAFPGLKLVIFDDRREPRFPGLSLSRERLIIDEYAPLIHDMARALQSVIGSGRRRVVGLRIAQDQIEGLWQLLWRLHTERGFTLRSFYLEAEFHSRRQFANDIYRRLCSGKRPPPRWASEGVITSGVIPELAQAPIAASLPSSIFDQRSLDLPEASFTALVDQALEAVGDTHVCIVVRPYRSGPLADWTTLWHEFVNGLRQTSSSARVTWILLDVDGQAPLPEPKIDAFTWLTHEFVIGAAEMEQGLVKSLALPDLPIPIRIQNLMMLGGLRASQGHIEESLGLLTQSVELAEAEGSVEQQANGWWALGNALQRGQRLPEARNAYAEATSIALDSGNDLMSANALMSLGHTYFLEREWGHALETYQVARKYWENAGQVFGECYANTWIGEVYRQAQHYDDAERSFSTIEATYKAMGAPFEDVAAQGLAEVRARLARLYDDQGRDAEAAHYRQQAASGGIEEANEWPA